MDSWQLSVIFFFFDKPRTEILTNEPFVAKRAQERFDTGMNARVRLQVATGGKSFTARQTHVTFLVCQKKSH